MTTINLYNYDGHPDTINKTLGDAVALEGDLRKDFDVTAPMVTIRATSRPTYNYCQIPSMGRYYFVDGVSFVGNNSYTMRLRVDVLKTYEGAILEAMGTVSETDTPNPHISSRESVYNRVPNFEKVEFPNKGLLNEGGSIIMVTIKGNN